MGKTEQKEYQIKWYKTEDLKPADYNPRTITKEAQEGLEKSISRYGFLDPIIINLKTGNIISGHQRWSAAKNIGIEKVPVVEMNLEEHEEKALNISLNNPKIQGIFVPEKIAGILNELEDYEFYSDLRFDDLHVEFGNIKLQDLDSDLTEDFDELDVKKINLKNKCPKCGFEFD